MNTGFVKIIVMTTCICNYIISFRMPFEELSVLYVATIKWLVLEEGFCHLDHDHGETFTHLYNH